MARTNGYTAQQFIDAIPGTGGIVATIARRVGCVWHTAKKYIEAYPTVQQVYQDECEAVLDLAESVVIEAIHDRDMQMVRYYLSTKGKHRGYTEKQQFEHSGPDGGPQHIILDWGDNGIDDGYSDDGAA